MSDKKYWTTLEQLEGAEEYLRIRDDEFRNKPFEDMEEGGSVTASRRGIIKAGGAAAVFMSAMGCNPEVKLVPYLNQPEESIPGNPVFYASVDAEGENSLVVKTTEGRPIRLDGNEASPVNKGKLDAVGNAAIIDLYDPDRLREAVRVSAGHSTPAKVEVLISEIAQKLKSAGSKSVLVTNPVHGVGQQALYAKVLKAFPGLRHVQVSSEVGVRSAVNAQLECFGQKVLPYLRYDRAKVIVSLGFDILAESPNRIEVQRLFAEARRYKEDGTMGRVVCFEPTLSMTGAAGDERFRVVPQALPAIALALATEISKLEGVKVPAGVALKTSSEGAEATEKIWNLKAGCLSKLAAELWENKGKSLVVAGGTGAECEGGDLLLAAVNLINVMLENDGKTIQYADGSLNSFCESEISVAGLIADAKAGMVDALLIVDVNLAYALPAQADLASAFQKIPYKVALLSHLNETGLTCDVVLPISHFLESWNDGEPRKGLYVIGQPTIAPLWQTKERQQLLLDILAASGDESLKDAKWADFLKKAWQDSIYGQQLFAADFENFWMSALRAGLVDLGLKARRLDLPVRSFRSAALKSKAPAALEGFQLVTYRTILHGKGESMNNPWLLETPDPVSKICWDNYASFNIKNAKEQKLSEGDYISIKIAGAELLAPVHIQPGLADGVIAVALGWGRGPEAGQVAAGPSGNGLGVNVLEIAPVVGGKTILSGIAVQGFSKTGQTTKLACVQGHQYLENDRIRMTGEGSRKILQEAFLKQFSTEGDESWKIPEHGAEDISLWRQKFNDATTHKWAMAVDTNTCTGCGACTVSCQAENNISTVGKDQVILNREMHWIRIDRYYTAAHGHAGDGEHKVEEMDDVDVVQQPMLCQHCDNAPCETVCPVIATSHNEEGLNVQTYNRCVGTRYCSNNCPYKVRHYNWYEYKDYRAGLHESGRPLTRFLRQMGIRGKELKDKTEYPLMLQFNPDVTVRSRGVMEKCSFCVHKIRRWHQEERALGRNMDENLKQTACQQACPANAITFGNMMDPKSAFSKVAENKGAYKVLKALNTQSNVTYFTRLRNREMPANAVVSAHGHGQENPAQEGGHGTPAQH